MTKIYIKDKRLWRDEKPISLVSGEVHYWRLEPSDWETVLRAGMEMGLETIASYISWQFHEFEEGKFDFTGETDPKRDLVSYLKLVQKLDLNLFVRPGPYIFAETHNYGIPDYVVPFHRLHPKFLKAASRYLKNVCDVIRPFLATNGGPIVLCQVDNMFDLGQHRYDRQLGFFGGDGIFQDFLKKKYREISSLNKAWGTKYVDFTQVMAVALDVVGDQATHNRHADFQEFKHWFTAESASWTVNEYRKNGINVPLYSNATRDQDLTRMSEVLDLVAFNHYPSKSYSLVPGEHQVYLDHVRLLPMLSPLPYVVELESGVWHGGHFHIVSLTSDHYRYLLLTILAGGEVAWTWFMLHDRDNYYMCPLNNRGQKRIDLFPLFSQFIALEKEVEPHEWQHCSKTGISYYSPHDLASHSSLSARDTFEVSKKLYEAGLDHIFYNLQSPGRAPDLLFYDGLEWLDRKAQQVLLDYILNGGHLVIFQKFPFLDDKKNPCNLLGIPQPDGIDAQGYMNTFYKDYEVYLGNEIAYVEMPKAVYVYKNVPGEGIFASRCPARHELNDSVLGEYQSIVNIGNEKNLLVGYHQKRGKGTLTFLGTPPSPDLLIKLHDFLKVHIPVLPLCKNVQTIVYRRNNLHYLVVLNDGQEGKGVTIRLDHTEFPGKQYAVRDILDGDEQVVAFSDSGRKLLTVQIKPKNGSIFEISDLNIKT